jgi:hypothetical protein
VQIDDVNYKNLEDILIVLHPIRVLNPLLSYYLRENNIEKANMVAKFIDDNLDKITKQNLSAENQKKPDDFTYNANDLIKINQKRLAYDLYNKANDLVLKRYNDIFYNSILHVAITRQKKAIYVGIENLFIISYMSLSGFSCLSLSIVDCGAPYTQV